ncbi:MAG TPA: AMP-binding protein, partial [Candidatus Caenarcaniphilales bacterium]
MTRSSAGTLIDALDNSAARYPQSKLCFSDLRAGCQEVSFAEIAAVSQRYAQGLQRLGLKQGDLVGLHLSTRPEFVFSLIGTIRAGGVPVPLPTYAGFQGLAGFVERLIHIVEHSGATYIITEQRLLDWVQGHLGQHFRSRHWLTPEAIDASEEYGPLPRLESNDLCLVQYTSGSTAAPKGIALTHRNVLAGLKAIADQVQLSSADVWCSWLPLYHDMGLIGMLCGLVQGVSQYLYKPRSFIGNPGTWLSEFSRCGGTLYAGPSFSFAHMLNSVDDQQLAALDLSRWRIAFNGSEFIDPLVVEQFIERFKPAGFQACAMFPVYGMAEATLAVSFPVLGSHPLTQWVDSERLAEAGQCVKVERSHFLARGVLCVGKAVPGHTVRIVDAQGVVLPDNLVGEVQLQGPAVMGGYYGNATATAAALRNGWLCTGDLGYLSEGLLFITGRAKEMISVNGKKFYPQEVEQLVHTLAGVYKGHAVALGQLNRQGEQMLIVLESDLRSSTGRSRLIHQLRSRLSQHLGLCAISIYLLRPGAMPRTSSGKYQRLLLREQLRQGHLHDKLWPERYPND